MTRRRKSEPRSLKSPAQSLGEVENFSGRHIDKIIGAVGLPIPMGTITVQRVDPDSAQYVERRVSRKNELKYRLEAAAENLSIDYQLKGTAAAPSDVATELAGMAQAARTLLSRLPKPDAPIDAISARALDGLHLAIAQYARERSGYPCLFNREIPAIRSADGQTAYVEYFPKEAFRRLRLAVEWLGDAAARASATEKQQVGRGKRYQGDEPLRTFIGSLAGAFQDLWEQLPTAPYSARKRRPDSPFVRLVLTASTVLGIDKSDAQLADLARARLASDKA